MPPVDSIRYRKANETHWHAVRHVTSLLSPEHLGKAGRSGSCPKRNAHQLEAAASVEALRRKAPCFFDAPARSGPERLRVLAAVSHPIEESPPERLAPRTQPDGLHRTRPALFILNPSCWGENPNLSFEQLMTDLLHILARNGYSLVFGMLLAEAVGFPLPAAIALIAAGAAMVLRPGMNFATTMVVLPRL